MTRFRITIAAPGAAERTWVLLPDEASAVMQATELAQRERAARVRVYREETGLPRSLVLDLDPATPGPTGRR